MKRLPTGHKTEMTGPAASARSLLQQSGFEAAIHAQAVLFYAVCGLMFVTVNHENHACFCLMINDRKFEASLLSSPVTMCVDVQFQI